MVHSDQINVVVFIFLSSGAGQNWGELSAKRLFSIVS